RLSARCLSTLISDSCRVLAARKASHWPLLSACSRLAPRRSVLIASQLSSGNFYFDGKLITESNKLVENNTITRVAV
ncbi:hypothetical protein MTR67_030455, partial [Solanum verrucosum]